jgi:D-alanyl-D-alanine dipeptidase
MTGSVFGDLSALREKPIPDQSGFSALTQRAPPPHDARDPRGEEPLASATDIGLAGLNHYSHPRNPPYYAVIPGATRALLVRQGVGKRLAAVNARLAVAGLELFLFDGWRPTAVQTYFHDVWMPAELRKADPTLEGAALVREVERYWAAPTRPGAPPAPHNTGGAVDLTIRWADTREPLWMGTLFDDVCPASHAAHFERRAPAPTLTLSEDEAMRNRRLLHWLMRDAGFAHNANEWWHFSFGEFTWARITGAPVFFYGAIEPLA